MPALAKILPGGGLQAGGSYSAQDSTTLALALLAGPSVAGNWCSVVGVPGFSLEAAVEYGINLDRLVLVPYPEKHWLAVVSLLIDIVSVVLTRAPDHIAPADVARLKARLRKRGAVLLTLGSWQHSDSILRIAESEWGGLGSGTGHLRTRRMKITATHPSGRSRHSTLWLTDLHRKPWTTAVPTSEDQRILPTADKELAQKALWPRLVGS